MNESDHKTAGISASPSDGTGVAGAGVDKIKQLARQYAPDLIAIRHHLHAHPELSYQEFETSKYVQAKLTELDIPFRVMAGTGVVGLIKGKNPGKRVVALRADM